MGFDPVTYKSVEGDVYSLTASSYDKYGGKIFEAYASPMLEGAELKPGYHVLDIACGPGIPSFLAAELVAPNGSVVGIDLADGMVELAKSKARERGLTNLTFRQADAENIPFAEEAFDKVLCNHGLVHTTDRSKALREMWRVLKKGGLLALSVWSTPDRALTIGIVAKAIRESYPQAMVPGAPMWFDFGPEGVLENALSQVGFEHVRTQRYTIALEIPTAEEYWQAVVGISGRLQMLLQNVPSDVASNIKLKVLETAARFSSAEGIKIPCEEVIAWASK